MKILFITGSRGEYGYIRPILKLIEKSKSFEYEICVTNMHLLSSYGRSIKEFESDGFKVKHKIYMSYDEYNFTTQIKSLGSFLSSLGDILENNKPDLIMLAGDRGEQLIGSIAGAFAYIPVAHIQAGELSGNIDGATRHAIGKFSHIHFASNHDAEQRLLKLGEEPFRVHNVGAPQIDEMISLKIPTNDEIMGQYNFDLDQSYILFIQHPVTEDYEHALKQIKTSIRALETFDIPKIVILPNNDAGSNIIKNEIQKANNYFTFSNLKREVFMAFLKNCSLVVGNSSCGLLEAPTFKIPAVNIGRRQKGRVRGENVIDVEFEENQIIEAINKCFDSKFLEYLNKSCKNPYGDGKSSERILKILSGLKIDDKLVVKTLTY